MLQVVWLGEGGLTEVHNGRVRVFLAADPPRLLRGLSGARRADGNDARGCGRHGLGVALGRGQPAVSQPQTSEHLAAVEIMKLQHIIIVQNKIDLIAREAGAAQRQYEDIKKFIAGSVAEEAPIIPISAQMKYNVDVVVDYICRIPIPLRDFLSAPVMIVIRSFDVNKPGEDADTLKGGVAGGTILKGVLKIGDEIEIRPGLIRKDAKTGQVSWEQIFSKVT